MIRAPRLTYGLTEPTRPCIPAGAQALAHAYLVDVSRDWGGESAAMTFGERLATFLGAGLPPEPGRPADACSPHGAGGRGIRWYASGDEVLGYFPGCAAGYRIPATCIAGLMRAVRITLEQPTPIAFGTLRPRRTGGGAGPREPVRSAPAPAHLKRSAVTGAFA